MSRRNRLQRAWTRHFERMRKCDPETFVVAVSIPDAYWAAKAYSRRTRNAHPRELFKKLGRTIISNRSSNRRCLIGKLGVSKNEEMA